MAKNKDNAAKAARGKEVKNSTKAILKECEGVTILQKDNNLSKNSIEKASYDEKVKINAHDEVAILITTTSSFRDDRLDTANTRMRRVKRRYDEQKKKCICIVTSSCDGERTKGDDSKLLNAYNFGDREEVGIDLLVKSEDLVCVLQSMMLVEEKNDVAKMIAAAKACIKKKNY
jgi:hypothetical protein